MRCLFLLLTCLVAGPVFADSIGNVEYQLPKNDHSWKVANEFKTTEKVVSATTLYVPGNADKDSAKEFFSIHVNDVTTDLNDLDSLKKGIETIFPGNKINITVLEKAPQSVIYEWTVNDHDKVLMYGLTRVLGNDKETAMLTYQTVDLENFSKIRSLWIQTLKEAKLTK